MISKRIAVVVLGLTLAAAGARGDDAAPAQVDNPLFTAWNKCEVGATCGYEADLPAGPGGAKVHATATSTLKEKTADGVKVETTGKVGENAMPTDTKTLPAKIDASAAKQTGEEEVKIGEKTYKCKIYELGPTAAGEKDGPTLTVDVCEDVPGGIVRAVGKEPGGQEMKFTMTEFKAK